MAALVNRYGSRRVACIGALLASGAWAAAAVAAPNLYVFIALYSVCGGIGIGLVFLPAYVHVGVYFERRRALATGIAVAGCGLGTFGVATLLTYLLNGMPDV